MRLLLRMAFWLGVVIVLLPSPMLPPASPAGPTHSTAARNAGTDAREACPRRLDACSASLQAFAKLGRDFYRRLTERIGERDKLTRENSSDTLTAADLTAPWRGSAGRATAAKASAGAVR